MEKNFGKTLNNSGLKNSSKLNFDQMIAFSGFQNVQRAKFWQKELFFFFFGISEHNFG